MDEMIEAAEKLFCDCLPEEQTALKRYFRRMFPHPLEKLWGLNADTILSAIERSSDLTKRGVRGIIAEAVFEMSVADSLRGSGWALEMLSADVPYDAILRNAANAVKVQIKLQRSEKGIAKFYYPKYYPAESLFVVEVQKTRSGLATVKGQLQHGDTVLEDVAKIKAKTRPYKFGDFDILAVHMHPSSGDWNSFRYTLASWLLPRSSDKNLIEIFQPVAAKPNEVWTNDLATCLRWFESEELRTVLSELPHVKVKVEKPKHKAKKKAKGKGKRQPVPRKLPESETGE
jgi:hypothetical protein